MAGMLNRVHKRSVVNSFTLSVASAVSPTLLIQTAAAVNYTVDWGDGTVLSYPSGTLASHIYAAPFNGVAIIQYPFTTSIFSVASGGQGWDYNLSEIPATVTALTHTGSTAIHGSVSSLPSALSFCNCPGANDISGNTANFPAGLNLFYFGGSNTITGDIADIAAGTTIGVFSGGLSSVYGSVASIKPGVVYFHADTTGSISQPSPFTWPAQTSGFRWLELHSPGMDTTSVENTLAALTAVTSWSNEKTVYLAGPDGPVTSLQGWINRETILAHMGVGGQVVVNGTEPLQPSISIGNASANEGNSVDFIVGLSSAYHKNVTFGYSASDGTAVGGTNYQPSSGNFAIPPGSTTMTISVPTFDLDILADLNFTMTISSPVNATLGTATGTGTVVHTGAAAAPFAGTFGVTYSPVTSGLAVSTQYSDGTNGVTNGTCTPHAFPNSPSYDLAMVNESDLTATGFGGLDFTLRISNNSGGAAPPDSGWTSVNNGVGVYLRANADTTYTGTDLLGKNVRVWSWFNVGNYPAIDGAVTFV